MDLIKLFSSGNLRKINPLLVAAVLPWIAIIALLHMRSIDVERIAALEKKQVELQQAVDGNEETAVIYAGTAIGVARNFEREANDQFQEVWKAMSVLEKMCRKRP